MTGKSIENKMKQIEEITKTLGKELKRREYFIDDMKCPHEQPSKLPEGYGAVYIFVYEKENLVLKIGKVNKNSNARFCSQHYGFSSKSTLARTLCNDEKFKRLGVNEETVKGWMLDNLRRINIFVKADKASIELIEAVLHYSYRPKYEGNI